MTRSANEWVELYAADLGIAPPTEEELNALLGLAGVAAHASERTAAPVTCWLAARAGVDPADALAAGERLAAQLGKEGD